MVRPLLVPLWVQLLSALLLWAPLLCSAPPAALASAERPHAMLSALTDPVTGDLDAILRRGSIRILVEYGRTGFFVDGGAIRGFEYELAYRFVEQLRKSSPQARALNVLFVPLPFDKILPALAEGRGDIAAATFTITRRRAERVDFSRPYLTKVRGAVVAGRDARTPETLADLQGAAVHAEPGTSFVSRAKATQDRMRAEGLEPFELVTDELSTEDILEMANAGIVDYAVADDFMADLWAKALPRITVSPVSFGTDDEIGWALRKDTPKLKAAVDAYLARNARGSLVGNVLFERYFQSTRWIEHPLDEPHEDDRLRSLEPIFRDASREQGIEWLLLAAQGYQESRLDQKLVSDAGAVGVMQILPSTAKDPILGGADIYTANGNITGGARYMKHLRARYQDVPQSIDAWAFAFAAYNAGPGRLNQARKRAKARGYDPDRWQGNVEYALMELVGLQPVRYVGNIRKYYVAYRLGLDRKAAASPPKR